MSIDPKVASRWPEPYRSWWIKARLARAHRRNLRDHTKRGGRFRELIDHGEPVG